MGGLPEISFYASAPIPLRMELPASGGGYAQLELTPAPVDPELERRIRSIVQSELGRYPTGTLDCLDAVMIGGELTVAKNAGKGENIIDLIGIITASCGDHPDNIGN